jgi:DNA-binding MarR family transcriptional regulator
MYGYAKIISVLKKQLDKWALEELKKNGFKDFKIAYMPVIMNIDLHGTRNFDLAMCAKMTKQAMSKLVKELQKKGYVAAKTDENDKRGVVFTLTNRGKDFVTVARQCFSGLMNEYRKEFGKKNFDDLLDKLLNIIEYNDKNLNGRISSSVRSANAAATAR